MRWRCETRESHCEVKYVPKLPEGRRGEGLNAPIQDQPPVRAGAAGEAVFLPTGSLQLLDTLHAMRPRHHMVAADFDHLPEVVIPGRNAPLVASTVREQHSGISCEPCKAPVLQNFFQCCPPLYTAKTELIATGCALHAPNRWWVRLQPMGG